MRNSTATLTIKYVHQDKKKKKTGFSLLHMHSANISNDNSFMLLYMNHHKMTLKKSLIQNTCSN